MTNTSRHSLWIPLCSVVLCVLAGSAWARPAAAQIALEPVTLSYRASAPCSEAAFLNEVRRYTPRMRLADMDATAGTRHFDVAISDDGLTGKLTIDGGSAGMREAHGANCAEVSRLLAFAMALAVDPEATQKGDEPSPAPVPAPSATSAAPVAAPASVPPEAKQRTTGTPLGGSVGAFGSAERAGAPSASFGGGVFGALQLRSPGWRPLARLALGYAGSADAHLKPGGTVSFSDMFAELDACPLSLESGRWSLAPCAHVTAIRTTATASPDVPHASTGHPFQLDFGLAARARARIDGPLFAELGGGVLFPIGGDVTVKEVTPVRIHTVPTVAAFVEFAVGVEFR